jgi:GDPmannose 4,6-dehydratase
VAGTRALITGITGQDGSFLAELLLEKGYEVVGLRRRGEASLGSSEHLREAVEWLEGELLDPGSMRAAVERTEAREIYHLAAPSFVPASWERPRETMAAIAGSCAAVLEAVRASDPTSRVFVPASGAIFGDADGQSPQREDTPCRPASPYAVAKLAAHELVGAMRSHEGLHASSGILYNHESERRPEHFVVRKVTRAAAAISLGLQQELVLGSLDAVRDWSHARDIMEGAWLMLQQERAGDYVLASGVPRTVRELVATAFACVGLEAEPYLRVDEQLVRAREPTPSVGDPTKARELLGWRARVSFEQMIEQMVRSDLRSLRAAAGGAPPAG